VEDEFFYKDPKEGSHGRERGKRRILKRVLMGGRGGREVVELGFVWCDFKNNS